MLLSRLQILTFGGSRDKSNDILGTQTINIIYLSYLRNDQGRGVWFKIFGGVGKDEETSNFVLGELLSILTFLDRKSSWELEFVTSKQRGKSKSTIDMRYSKYRISNSFGTA